MSDDQQRRLEDAQRRKKAFEIKRLQERGYEEFDRGYEEFDRGYEEFDRGYEEFDRGYEEFDRGYEEFDRGYEEFDRGAGSRPGVGSSDPRRVALNTFRQVMALGGHFVVGFVTPIGRAPAIGRPGSRPRILRRPQTRSRPGAKK